MRWFLTACAAAVVLAGSAAARTSSSGLWGVVMRGPTTPVCTAEEPCSAPAKGVTLVFWRNGQPVGRATTNADGRYRLALGPGVYSVHTGTAQSIGRRLEPTRAQVLSGRYKRLDFSIDTGIR